MSKLPDRLMPLAHVCYDVRDLFPDAIAAMIGQWLHENRGKLWAQWGGGHTMPANQMPGVERVRQAVDRHVGEAAAALSIVPQPVLRDVESLLVHHAHTFVYNAPGDDDIHGLGCELVLTSAPQMFRGGDLVWPNGEIEPPRSGFLSFWPANRPPSVREVECWSAKAIHGRWSFFTWIPGLPA